jgi:hypothetical protein
MKKARLPGVAAGERAWDRGEGCFNASEDAGGFPQVRVVVVLGFALWLCVALPTSSFLHKSQPLQS